MSDAAPPVPPFAGRRVLVIGASGFIGRWTVRAFRDAGADVHVTARDPDRTERVLLRVGARATLWRADLTAPGSAAEAVERIGADLVVNASGYGVHPAQREPAALRRMNTDLPEELARALAARPSRPDGVALVHVGSAAEYGDAGGCLDEEGPARPASPYGVSKHAGTTAVGAVARAAGLRTVVARAFTVYGPGEPDGRLVPTLVACARSGAPVPLSSGVQRRDFCYVEDVAEGLVRLAAAPAGPGTVVNVASGTLLAVRDFVRQAAQALGIPSERLRFGEAPGTREEMEHDPVTTERLVRLAGWRPATGVADGVRRTARFLGEGRVR